MTASTPPRTHAETLSAATARLAAASATPRLDAEVLLRHASGLDRTALFLAMREVVDAGTSDRFAALVARRLTGEPIAYITGSREFMGLTFAVTADVLVPRPETELLVEWALATLPDLGPEARTVDVGSGSGAIAVSLAALAATRQDVIAIEPSPPARTVVTRNAAVLLPPSRQSTFRVVAGDLLSSEPGPFHLVLANLPYLTPEQIAENPDLAAEPRLALDGGDGGLALITRLIGQLPQRLAPRCAVGLEIDPSQAATVSGLLRETLPGAIVTVIQDYAGLDRHVVATSLT